MVIVAKIDGIFSDFPVTLSSSSAPPIFRVSSKIESYNSQALRKAPSYVTVISDISSVGNREAPVVLLPQSSEGEVACMGAVALDFPLNSTLATIEEVDGVSAGLLLSSICLGYE